MRAQARLSASFTIQTQCRLVISNIQLNNIQILLPQFVERERGFVTFVKNAKTNDKNVKIKIISIRNTFANADVSK